MMNKLTSIAMRVFSLAFAGDPPRPKEILGI